jgi:hypothetical protein
MKQLKFNAKRVFEAVSKIGYKPSSAIADIIDNSVSASASKIDVFISILPNKTLPKGNNINKIIIIDNGIGMNESGIENALTLGSSNVHYTQETLSKYGMGLKSAGFSLGDKITLTSQKPNEKKHSWYLDINKLEDGYNIYQTEDLGNYFSQFESKINSTSFTIVEIENCSKKTNNSAKQVYEELINKLGVMYYSILNNNNLEINIFISQEGIDNTKLGSKISAKDILFRNFITSNEFNKDTYDCLYPIRVFNELIQVKGVERKANLEIVIFPMDTMYRKNGFTVDQKELIKSYEIASQNAGFFIYRNGRLISWGDRIKYAKENGTISTIVKRNALGFRAVLNIYTEHDDALNVDVSKQHLDMPDDFIETLESLCRNPIFYSEEAFKKCSDTLNKDNENRLGENFTEKNKYLTEEDPDEENLPSSDLFKIDDNEALKRRKEIEEKSNSEPLNNEYQEGSNIDNLIIQTEEEESVSLDDSGFLKIRYSNDVDRNKFWEHGFSSDYGVFARINKNHHYYSNILARLSSQTDYKESIEGIIWALAAAEHLTLKNLTSIPKETIEIVLNKFQKTFTYNLDSWSTQNNDLQL